MEGYTDSFVYPFSVGNVSYRKYNYGPRFRKDDFKYTHMQPKISQDQLNMSSFKTSFGGYGVRYVTGVQVRRTKQLGWITYTQYWWLRMRIGLPLQYTVVIARDYFAGQLILWTRKQSPIWYGSLDIY